MDENVEDGDQRALKRKIDEISNQVTVVADRMNTMGAVCTHLVKQMISVQQQLNDAALSKTGDNTTALTKVGVSHLGDLFNDKVNTIRAVFVFHTFV
jgi:hypothetical protein